MMKIFPAVLLFYCCFSAYAQVDSVHYVKLHFLYGSKPIKKYKATEPKYFGGLHGGHVSIQVGNMDYGFEPTGRVHVFSHRKKPKSDYVDHIVNGPMRYDSTSKVVTFIIPLTTVQYNHLNQINQRYSQQAPFDYAFFGMRCASTTQDILAQIGVVKSRKRILNISTTFYPKMLRRRMFKLAEQNHYQVIRRPGRPTRMWEKD